MWQCFVIRCTKLNGASSAFPEISAAALSSASIALLSATLLIKWITNTPVFKLDLLELTVYLTQICI